MTATSDQTAPGRPVPPDVPDVVVENVAPNVDGGRFAAKAVVGRPLRVEADVFAHGHDLVRALVRSRRERSRRWNEAPMRALGNDRFAGAVVPEALGCLEIEVVGALDPLATWARDARRRLEASRPDPLDSEVGGALLVEAAEELVERAEAESVALVRSMAERVHRGLDLALLDELDALAPLLAHRAILSDEATTVRTKAVASRERAAFSSWYELFPRSASDDPTRPGTLADVAERLGYIDELGFDVVYLPPVHPIGRSGRKGRNNSTVAAPDDVGSPWAIGAEEGGHTAIAPELGTFEDFDRLVEAAQAHGMEVAIDLAFQASPDHPWVRKHEAWFRHRPDGTIACAENPPKRYEDIYPLDFHTEDREALWQELLGVVLFWVGHGVRIFRVDNPHTKPFAFWEWLIAEVKRGHPDVVFLSEAFTRPRVMHRLAKLGFDQSYTYFAWRDAKWEIEQYFEELAHGPGAAYFRSNVWPNTPDILAKSLQRGGRPSFIARLVLAGGLSANYGIYGPVFELLWDAPAAPGSEEYLNSEKYEVHHHDLESPHSIRGVVAKLNALRRAHPALQYDEGLRFRPVDNDSLVAWTKSDPSGIDVVIGVVNLDWQWAQSGFVELDLSDFGILEGDAFEVHDVLTEETFVWRGGRNFVKLDPRAMPAHLLEVRTLPPPPAPPPAAPRNRDVRGHA